jgi:hypothetical protein
LLSGSAGQLGHRRTTGRRFALLIFRHQRTFHVVLAVAGIFVGNAAVDKQRVPSGLCRLISHVSLWNMPSSPIQFVITWLSQAQRSRL